MIGSARSWGCGCLAGLRLPRWLLAWVLVIACGLVTWSPAPSDAQIPSYPIPAGHAHLVVVTSFDVTEVQINGVAYPYEWIWGNLEGVFVPAPRYYEISVATSPEQRRTFRFNLREGERRVLVVDVENIGARPVAPLAPAAPPPAAAEEPAAAEGEQEGYLGVSSSPRGTVYVDGSNTGMRTPARRIPLEPGRHEVTVFYDDEEEMSEVKHVLIRAGVNTNVFFRRARDRETTE